MTTENQLLIAVRLLQKIDSEFTVDPARVAFLRGRGVAVDDSGKLPDLRQALAVGVAEMAVDGKRRVLRVLFEAERVNVANQLAGELSALPARKTEFEGRKAEIDGLTISDRD